MSDQLSHIEASGSVGVVGVQEGTKSPHSTAGRSSSAKPMQPDDLKHLVDELNEQAKASDTKLSFSLDSDAKRIIIRVVETSTNKVIRQIPPEEALRLQQALKRLFGVLVDGTG